MKYMGFILFLPCCLKQTSLHCDIFTGDPLHSRALAHSRAPLFTQPCPHCSHSRALREQWARLCVFTLQGCVQAARLCRGSPVILSYNLKCIHVFSYKSWMIIIQTSNTWFRMYITHYHDYGTNVVGLVFQVTLMLIIIIQVVVP